MKNPLKWIALILAIPLIFLLVMMVLAWVNIWVLASI